jgi:hypothetical protein
MMSIVTGFDSLFLAHSVPYSNIVTIFRAKSAPAECQTCQSKREKGTTKQKIPDIPAIAISMRR